MNQLHKVHFNLSNVYTFSASSSLNGPSIAPLYCIHVPIHPFPARPLSKVSQVYTSPLHLSGWRLYCLHLSLSLLRTSLYWSLLHTPGLQCPSRLLPQLLPILYVFTYFHLICPFVILYPPHPLSDVSIQMTLLYPLPRLNNSPRSTFILNTRGHLADYFQMEQIKLRLSNAALWCAI